VLVRRDLDLSKVGEVAELPADPSPIQIGTSGRFEDNSFTVTGRIVYEFDAGTWNEWHVSFQDGTSGWLSDAQLEYSVYRQIARPGNLPADSTLTVGQRYGLHGASFAVITLTHAHYRGVERLPGKLEGNITIFWFAHGWFWLIPLADGTTSIGAVCWPYYLKSRTKPLKEFFHDTIALCPELERRLKNATLVDDAVHATGNYSYTSSHATGERYLMLGDAYTFIDPMFSTGVYLAMQSAFAGVDVIEATLAEPARAKALRAAFDKSMRFGPSEFSWIIFRVTNPTIRDFFMYPQNPFGVKEGLISMLAGDVFGSTPIWGRVRLSTSATPIRSATPEPPSFAPMTAWLESLEIGLSEVGRLSQCARYRSR
jgi:hypothetical protein